MPADLSPVRPGNAERLSRRVQLATTADDGEEPFAAFEALLAAEYPRAHARLALEKVTDRGLLYLWKGASSDRPVVLMAYYDVVPADQGWNPFDVAESRGRIPTHRAESLERGLPGVQNTRVGTPGWPFVRSPGALRWPSSSIGTTRGC